MKKKIVPRTRDEVYHLWLDALRSGKYKQTQGLLCEMSPFDADGKRSPVSFCCLGVLADLAVKDGGPAWNSYHGPQEDGTTPPVKISHFMGFDNEIINELIEMNDDRDATFDEIADVIETVIMPALGVK